MGEGGEGEGVGVGGGEMHTNHRTLTTNPYFIRPTSFALLHSPYFIRPPPPQQQQQRQSTFDNPIKPSYNPS